MTPAVGVALFGLAALTLGAQGLGVLLIEGTRHGPGQWISAGAVSFVVFAAFAVRLWHELRRPATA
jgi:ABC-type proline/glycine betaine transport system permease subunit